MAPNDILRLEDLHNHGIDPDVGGAHLSTAATTKARPLQALLEEWGHWAELRAEGVPVPLPTVTLHLRHGREFAGIVRSMDGANVLLEPVTGDRIYVPFTEIQAITDHGFGPNEPVETAPTPLQFRRNLADWEAELRADFGVPITVESEMDPPHLGALDGLRVRVAEVTTAVARDREAYKAFARAVRNIRLSVAETPSLTLTNGTLHITTSRSIVDRMLTGQIRAALESLL